MDAHKRMEDSQADLRSLPSSVLVQALQDAQRTAQRLKRQLAAARAKEKALAQAAARAKEKALAQEGSAEHWQSICDARVHAAAVQWAQREQELVAALGEQREQSLTVRSELSALRKALEAADVDVAWLQEAWLAASEASLDASPLQASPATSAASETTECALSCRLRQMEQIADARGRQAAMNDAAAQARAAELAKEAGEVRSLAHRLGLEHGVAHGILCEELRRAEAAPGPLPACVASAPSAAASPAQRTAADIRPSRRVPLAKRSGSKVNVMAAESSPSAAARSASKPGAAAAPDPDWSPTEEAVDWLSAATEEVVAWPG